MTDLIFWRHAEAEDFSASGVDSERALTKRGHKDAAKIAKWLNKKLPTDAAILVSPALRCQQTVAALHEIKALNVTTLESFSVNGTPQQMLSIISTYSNADAVLVVGHQPNLGSMIAQCLGLAETAVSVKKGSVWWLRHHSTHSGDAYRIHSVTLPD